MYEVAKILIADMAAILASDIALVGFGIPGATCRSQCLALYESRAAPFLPILIRKSQAAIASDLTGANAADFSAQTKLRAICCMP